MEALNREKIATEKKFYIRINNNCNNNCIFCLDADNQKKANRPKAEILAEITKGRKDLKADKLIISGGEATISPDFLEYVKLGHDLGYKKIQVITNGRMLAYPDFARQAILNGLNEITFSIHGHTQELYEKLTNIPGSFAQMLQALTNVRQYPQVIVNIDIVINKLNYKHILDIINFFSQNFGVFEYDLLQVIPYGRAYQNKEQLFFDLDEAWPFLKPVFDLAISDQRFHIWTNRFPVKYLEGYEVLIQDPHKLFDEVHGRQEMFEAYLNKGVQLNCQDEFRCSCCFLQDFCQKLKLYQDKKEAKFYELANWQDFKPEKLWYFNLDAKSSHNPVKKHWFETKGLWLKFKNFGSLAEIKKQALGLTEFKEMVKCQQFKFLNLPYCLLPDFSGVNFDFFLNKAKVLNSSGQIDLQKFTEQYIDELYYAKPLKCRQCKYDKECSGWHINYIRYYGFKILKPRLK